uniref:DegT/DnrJ/EryC1/StrS family aminotransferase n=1 Tax=candidate division WOR-3 bacterium TaxID=2052148 RepID=A0A7V4E4R7_UNCW3
MKIPIIDLVRQHKPIMDELVDAFKKVVESGQFILGYELEQFEKEAANYLGSKYALGVGNGTDALILALRAIDVQKGDEVITTPFTFFATAETIAILGAKPVFVDIEDETLNIDVTKIEEKITKRTKAILPVHIFGQGAKIEKILEIARSYNLKVIEDTAQGFGAKRNGKYLGTFGDVGTFSFFPTKNLSCLGDGGLITTQDEAIYDIIKKLRVHGSPRKYYHEMLGYNSRLDTLQAAFLRVKMKYIDRWNERRREIAAIYNRELSPYVRVPEVDEGNIHIYHQYTIRTDRRDELNAFLNQRGIMTQVHYPIPLHLQPALSYLGYKEGDFPVAEKATKEVLSLPVFPEMTDEEINYVIDSIKDFFRGKKV